MQTDLESVLSQIESRANAATLGPWEVIEIRGMLNSSSLAVHSQGEGIICEVNKVLDEDKFNAAFIAAARSDVPALVKALRHSRAQLATAIGGDPTHMLPHDREIEDILTNDL